MKTKAHEAMDYPMGAVFTALPSTMEQVNQEWLIFDPDRKVAAVIEHKSPEVAAARARWIAQNLTLALFREAHPFADVPIPLTEDQARLMIRVGSDWLAERCLLEAADGPTLPVWPGRGDQYYYLAEDDGRVNFCFFQGTPMDIQRKDSRNMFTTKALATAAAKLRRPSKKK